MDEHEVHLPDEEGLLTGERKKRLRWIRHLLARCRTCLEPVRYVLEDPKIDENQAEASGEYDPALDRAFAAALSHEPFLEATRRRARQAVAEIKRYDDYTDAFIRRHRRHAMQGPIWVEALLERTFAERYTDLGEMVSFAEMARSFALHIDPAAWGEARVVDTQVRAWAELANAYRLQEKFSRAAEALKEAEKLLERSSQDPYLLARVFQLTAAFKADRRYLSDACELLESALKIYEDLGERHLTGQTLSQLALYHDYLGEHAEALQLIRQSIDRIDPERDPQLAATASQLLIGCLAENGEYREANRLLLASGLRDKLAGQPLSLLKLRWVEGQIWTGLGKLDRAENALSAVQHGFELVGKEYYVALVGLDLAAVWLAQGRNAEVRELSQEMLETFQDLGVQRECRRALQCFQEACVREEATPALARDVRRFLQRIEYSPGLRFEAA